MLSVIKAYLRKWVNQYSYGSDIERYILSKNPQTLADVEYWQQKYHSKENRYV